MKQIAQENIIELVKLGHERASELKASCGAVDVRSLAQLISDLATQLEVQLVRGNALAVQLANAESKCRELSSKAMELVCEASLVYSKYNDTQMPDRDLVDMQTLQEMHDLCKGVAQ